MSKRALFKRTATPEILDETDIMDFNPSFPGEKPLSVREKKQLAALENTITTNFRAFYEVGCALREINENRLYRETHTRFDVYCKDLWEMARRTAYQYIDAADVVDAVRHGAQIENVNHGAQIGDVPHGGQKFEAPRNERQARALIKFKDDPEKLHQIWTQAIETAPEGRITAAHIKKTANHLFKEKVKKAVKKAKKETQHKNSPNISSDFDAAFRAFLDQINAERESEWRYTDRKEVLRILDGIMAAIEAEV